MMEMRYESHLMQSVTEYEIFYFQLLNKGTFVNYKPPLGVNAALVCHLSSTLRNSAHIRYYTVNVLTTSYH